MYAQRRGRRQSKEFEDLNLDTKTGSLKQPFNVAKRLLSSKSRVKSSSLTKITSPRLQRSATSLDSPRGRLKSSDHSDESSSSAISSLEELHWIGDPEATKSVRRNRKTSEEQHLDFELKKLVKTKRQVTKKNSKWDIISYFCLVLMTFFCYALSIKQIFFFCNIIQQVS